MMSALVRGSAEGLAAPRLLRRLGIFGMEEIEPIVFAALAMEEPLLLIGPHGTAKTWLLLQLARALGLTFRHYNASLLNYDDLVGYPLPDAQGRLRFVETPASIWQAEVVLFDEISRCRPDMQNRLFPIIHEKRVQGLPLSRLVHRWAAMNPPVAEDDIEDIGHAYLGSEPLDAALADRFPLVVVMPSWESMSEGDRDAIIHAEANDVEPGTCALVRDRVEQVRARALNVRASWGRRIGTYVRLMSDLLPAFGVVPSPRRAGMHFRAVVAVHAARFALDPKAEISDSALAAITHSIPERALGRPVPARKLLLAHRDAWAAAGRESAASEQRLLAERDPVRRALAAGQIADLDAARLSAHVADGIAAAPLGGRHALAAWLVAHGVAGRINAAVAEQVAELHAVLVFGQDIHESTAAASARHETWKATAAVMASLPAASPDTSLVSNMLAGLFAAGELVQPSDAQRVLDAWRDVQSLAGEPAS